MNEFAVGSLNHEEKLERALRAKEQFLKQYPYLQSFQEEIDRILSKTVDHENRLKTLGFLIEKKLYELRDSIADLQTSFLMQSNELKVVNAAMIVYDSDKPTGYLN